VAELQTFEVRPTTTRGEIAKVVGFAADLGNVERVDLLPFHQMGRFKRSSLA